MKHLVAWFVVVCVLSVIFPLPPSKVSASEPIAMTAAVVPCAGIAGSHCINWSWNAPLPACSPACTYNLLEGSTPGGESATPTNSAPLTATTFQQPMTLGAAAQTIYAKVQAVETTGTLVQTATSAEVSVTFPALLNGPTNLVPSPE
jgi:hypothetical protein